MTEINLYARISKPFSRIERKPIQDYNWYSEHPDLNSFDFRVHYDFQSNRFADGLINFEYVDGNKFKIALGDKYFADDPND
jgi:hypothetical protein